MLLMKMDVTRVTGEVTSSDNSEGSQGQGCEAFM
jgi:hypothetical protein